MGGSSGGYLALMLGTEGKDSRPFPPPDDPTRDDPRGDSVEAVSSHVQAVIGYFPATDWLNYGETGKPVFEHPAFKQHQGILDLYTFDASRHGYDRVADRDKQLQMLKELSPVNRASRRCPPTLLFHGDKDPNVPLQQSESMVTALKAAEATAELVVRPGGKHGWADNPDDTKRIVEWLNTHLPRSN